ncbi:MAG: hypothetical protein AB1772_07825 [Candidatus Zixiibacteriota bacterium]
MKIKNFADQFGITLLEVMTAMILISCSLLILLHMAMTALDGNDWSHRTTVATQVLQEKLEHLRGGGTAALVSGSDTTHGMIRTWTVTDQGSHLRRVDIRVDWDDIKAGSHSNALTAYISTDSL